MKKFFILALFSFFLAAIAKSEDIALFDRHGEAVAYIATDKEMTIYLWDGEPVAYLVNTETSENPKSDLFSIYGFNGKFLGRLKGGILRDKNDNVTGFIRGVINIATSKLQKKGSKSKIPNRYMKEIAPMEPIVFSMGWAGISLYNFLEMGIGNGNGC